MKIKSKKVCAWLLLALVMGLLWYNYKYHSYGYPFLTPRSRLSYESIGHTGNGRKVKDGEWVQLTLVMKNVAKVEVQDQQTSAKETEQGTQNDSKETESNNQSSPKAEDQQKSGKKVKKYEYQEKILINEQNPFFLRFDQSVQSSNKQIARMIGMMQEEQRMVFKCSLGYLLEKKDLKNKEDEVVTDITLHKIMTDASYKEMLEADRAAQLAKDKKIIADYLAAHHIEAISTDSGLFYIIDQPSKGIPVVKDKTVQVHYTGRLLDGTIFDTSVEEIAKAHGIHNPKRPYEPLEFQVGVGQVIQGWDEGLLLLKKGEKARFFIPSGLAYGPGGAGNVIPKNAILVFEVELVDFS